MVRSITTGDPCRCCNYARENILHFATCEVAGKLWSDLLLLAEKAEPQSAVGKERFALFALLPDEKLESVWVSLHLLLWKHLIAAIVGVELDEGTYIQ